MPTIPDVTDIRRNVASGEQSVARARGGVEAAQSVGAITDAVRGLVDENARYQAARAKSDLMIAQTELENQDYSDVDYTEIEKTYSQAFKEKREAITSKVTNPYAKQAAAEQSELLYQRGLGKVRELAKRKEVDTERGNIFRDLEGLRETAVQGDVLGASESARELVESGIDNGYFGEEEGAKAFAKWREDAALGRIRMMEPERRLDALNQDWAKNIPSDTRAVLRREAEDANLATRAQLHSEGYREQGLSRLDAIERAETIRDADLRDETIRRINTDYDRQERNENERQNELYESLAQQVDMEGAGYDDLPRDALSELTASQRSNLRTISDARFNPRQTSDPDMLIELSVAAQTQDWDEYNRLIREESHRLSTDDRVKFTTKGIEQQLPEEAETGLTDVQAVAGVIAEAGIQDKQAKSQLLHRLGRWRQREMERTGKPPTERERTEFLDYLVMERDIGWMDFGTPMYQREPLEQVDILRKEDPDTFDTIVEYYSRRGIDPSAQQIIDLLPRVRAR